MLFTSSSTTSNCPALQVKCNEVLPYLCLIGTVRLLDTLNWNIRSLSLLKLKIGMITSLSSTIINNRNFNRIFRGWFFHKENRDEQTHYSDGSNFCPKIHFWIFAPKFILKSFKKSRILNQTWIWYSRFFGQKIEF